jgi:4-alpha-glucanotransferase
MNKRSSGVLLHVTSLPSPYGIGDFGPEAYGFADFLSRSGQSFWQILPSNSINLCCGFSPYHTLSAFAGNPLLISPQLLLKEGLLGEGDLKGVPDFPKERVDFPAVIAYKEKLFAKTYERFRKRKRLADYERFCREHDSWLSDYALFMALKKHFNGRCWNEWPAEIRDREPAALQKIKEKLAAEVEKEKILQYLFFDQWQKLKEHCNQKGVQIIGDVAIYMDIDSVDVWVNPPLFNLDENKRPHLVSGVPPDYFSRTGQLWGHPTYNWGKLQETGFAWWVERLRHNLKLFDLVRIDHFRGFVAYWEVKAGEKTAEHGRWVKAPVMDFFNTLLKHFHTLPILAEDLGIITPDVREVMQHFKLPGMRVLVFAFGEDNSNHPYLPQNYIPNCVVYTGTHDTNTVRGWFENEASREDKERLFKYLGRAVAAEEAPLEFIRLAMMSIANLAIIPLQDILALGQEARMNLPATTKGNWQWRLSPAKLSPAIEKKLLEMTRTYERI